MKSSSALFLLSVALGSASASNIGFVVDTAACDGDPFDDLDITVTCDGSSTCGFGDTALISGTVEAVDDFSDSGLTIKACILAYYCPEDFVKSAGTLCDWLVSAGGQSCGEAGTYRVSSEQHIPKADVKNRWSWMVTVRIGVEDDCEAEATAESLTMAYSAAGLTSLAAILYVCAARIRRDARVYGDDKSSRFIEMADGALV